ncbi:GTP cyclohydrolase II [Tropicibacter naphthalenivorans]|uniref:GTP cyclohydrolase-2 n=1 Tax=Tropicibacter naphthalenivorans TaxID=441103 RepID=A0A0P1G958_9RHOB|nr:GTP cyclohydrolase II [Tropicibacter naphthalenivorans]CUH78092.1 GTP cyclohydrolase-2 [Tropicibacter naphthalenivorans]SMC93751.1 GTP cyclohydrolase II [Tropicibacter naphthalenivorans]
MGLRADLNETLARARGDLRMGVPVVLMGQAGAVLVASAETVAPERMAAMAVLGPLDLALTGRRAETLKAVAYDTDVARVIVPEGAPLAWVRQLADPADDMDYPMKGPLQTRRDGDAALHRLALTLCKAARLLPAALVVPVPSDFAAKHGLVQVPAAEAAPLMLVLPPLDHVISAKVPLRAAENARLHIFRPEDGSDEHYAIEIGRPDREAPVLARLHSACFTGDLLGSLKCDCGPQLNAALGQMGIEGAGVLLYLNQEGRGIGLANKMRAYALQDQGFDTVEANHRLGFEDDERDFRLGAQILEEMGFSAVRLMTNNPAKIAMMERCGVQVAERVPLKVGLSKHNERYLAVKAAKSGHLL